MGDKWDDAVEITGIINTETWKGESNMGAYLVHIDGYGAEWIPKSTCRILNRNDDGTVDMEVVKWKADDLGID
jgi:hypothetical protein